MSRTYRGAERQAIRRNGRSEEFRCRHCHAFVGPTRYGGRHRNHCPFCLFSRHVDESLPGDRASACGGSMAPVGVFTRRGGEHMIIHECLTCGRIRHNRIAADDDFDLVTRLPHSLVASRSRERGRAAEEGWEERLTAD